MINIYDPRTIKDGFPYIVLSNQKNSWIGNVIDFRTDISGPGMFPVDHMMNLIEPGEFVTQGLTFARVKMEDYLIHGGQLWFVQLVNTNPQFVVAYRDSVLKRLALPPWLRSYDFLGIFGQAIGFPWIHTPFLDYCSVDVVSHMKDGAPFLPSPDKALIESINNESNPELVTEIIVDNPPILKIAYAWDSSTGITV